MIYWKHKRLYISRDIFAPSEQVWSILTDTWLWPRWGPSVRKVNCRDRFITQSTSAKIRTTPGFWLPFTITRYIPLHYWSWRIGAIEATGHSVKSRTPQLSTLAFDMPWWAVIYLPICWLALRRIEVLAGGGDSQRQPDKARRTANTE